MLLAARIRARKPLFFIRYGDGALECIYRQKGMTCDLEPYSAELGEALLDAWNTLVVFDRSGLVWIGDWLSASFDSASDHSRYADLYSALLGEDEGHLQYLHFEALLLMRESEALLDFYRAVKADSRRKLYMGPAENAQAAAMLGAEHLVTPMFGLFHQVDRLTDLLCASDFDVLLYGAGMAGNIPAIRCWERFPERTYVNLGSALDPLGRGRSRRQQLSPARAKALLQELL